MSKLLLTLSLFIFSQYSYSQFGFENKNKTEKKEETEKKKKAKKRGDNKSENAIQEGNNAKVDSLIIDSDKINKPQTPNADTEVIKKSIVFNDSSLLKKKIRDIAIKNPFNNNQKKRVEGNAEERIISLEKRTLELEKEIWRLRKGGLDYQESDTNYNDFTNENLANEDYSFVDAARKNNLSLDNTIKTLTFFSFGLNALVNPKVDGFIGFSNLKGFDDASINTRIGLNLSVGGGQQITEQLSMLFVIRYSSLKSKGVFDKNSNTTTKETTFTSRMRTLDVGANVRYSFSNNLYLKGGLFVGYVAQYSEKVTVGDNEPNNYEYERSGSFIKALNSIFDKTFLGLELGMGYNFNEKWGAEIALIPRGRGNQNSVNFSVVKMMNL